jgi:hypothetical protein
MANDETSGNRGVPQKTDDKYSGMRNLNFAFTPMVLLCGAGGAILGLILSLWAAGPEIGIVAATTIVMGILSGIFGMFL